MKFRPTLAAQALNHFIRRSHGQRNQQKESEHPNKDKRAPRHILRNRLEIEKFIEPHVGEKMKCGVKETVKTEHPTHTYQPLRFRQFTQRRHGQCQHQENEREHSARARDEFKRIRAQTFVKRIPTRDGQRYEAVNENDEFRKAYVLLFHLSF